MEKIVVWFDQCIEDVCLQQLIVVAQSEIPVTHCIHKMRESVFCLVVASILLSNLVEDSAKNSKELSSYANFSLETTAI